MIHIITVSKNNDGDYKTIAEALKSDDGDIFIKSGVYREKLIIDKPLRLIGEDNPVITYDDGAYRHDETGKPMGTFKTYSVLITGRAKGFSASGITFENSAGSGSEAGQAVAVYCDADKAVFKNCRFLGHQDTLLTGPIFSDIEKNPDILNRQCFDGCYIEGDIDFIFGGAVAVFNNCEIFSHDNPTGYLTAACTSKNMDYGYVFFDCKIMGAAQCGTVFLGRPWREYAKTVFIRCDLGEHINPGGFSVWEGTNRHENCYYAQYECKGYDEKRAASWAHTLTHDEAASYTIENIFRGFVPLV